jgi:hypothetical protein
MSAPITIGSPEWLGVSPFDSPRSLWHLMHGDIQPDPQTAVQQRGHYLEPAVLSWFFDQHPELTRRDSTGTTVHANGWAAASPDAEATDWDGDLVLVEAKTAADDSEWGTPGTAEIPVYYAAQCTWTMHVLGASRIFVPVLGSRLVLAEYVLDYDQALALDIERKCKAFLDSLTADEPPDLDAHPATYTSLRKLSPSLDKGTEAQLDQDTAAEFTAAVTAAKAADSRLTFAKSRVADAMGTAQLGFYGDQLVARRQNTSGSTPAIYAAKPLPTIEKSAAS